MESFRFSQRNRKQIETVVNFLEERYQDKNGKFDFRVSARNFVSGNKEPMVNHPLGVAIIALALLDEGIRNKHVPSRNKSELKTLRKKKEQLFSLECFMISVKTRRVENIVFENF